MTTVLVTGGNGFLGKHVLQEFTKSVYKNLTILSPTSKELNLLNKSDLFDYVSKYAPDVVLHMAAVCGGIGANKESPADFVHLNSVMTCNIFDCINKFNIKSVYTLGSVCSYPKFYKAPFKEDDLWNGYPEETNAPYGMAKRLQLTMQQSFMQQYGTKGAHFIPTNMLGEFDHFDLEKSHVIPALIRKFYEAKLNNLPEVVCWGTGSATREFIYAKDVAELIAHAVNIGFSSHLPINVGTGNEISIRDLAQKICDMIGYTGNIVWDTSKPDGQPRRILDVSRAKELLYFEAETDFDFALNKIILWYANTYGKYLIKSEDAEVKTTTYESTNDITDDNFFNSLIKQYEPINNYYAVDGYCNPAFVYFVPSGTQKLTLTDSDQNYNIMEKQEDIVGKNHAAFLKAKREYYKELKILNNLYDEFGVPKDNNAKD